MKYIVFKPTMPSVIAKLTTAALLLLVLAACYIGDSTKDKTITFKPIKLVAIGVNKGVDISWNAVTGATSYTVYYHTASFDSSTDNTTDGGVKSKTGITKTKTIITGLINGTEYYLRVESINADGDKELSKQVSAIANLQPPTKLQATGGDKIVDISWNAVTGATSYRVYYRKASFDSTTDSGVISTAGIATTNTSFTGLTDGTLYYLQVESINADGETKLSEEVTAFTILEAPTKLQATARQGAIDLSWDAVSRAASYSVYYHTASFDKTTDSGVISKLGITATNTSIGGLDNNRTYYFRVKTSNADGESKLSKQVSATVTAAAKLPAPHPSAAASIISPAAVDLTWNPVAWVTGYTIYYAKQSLDKLSGGYKNYASVDGKLETTTDTSVTIGDLIADTTYYFVVAANYQGEEAAASEVEAKSSYIAELAMGDFYGCVRLNTGSIKCWGNNNTGQLGVGDRTDRNTATSVPNFRAKQLSAGSYHSCAIDLSDRLYCWGSNYDSKLGKIGYHQSIPTLVDQHKLARVSLVAAGFWSTCALADGKNYCWGSQYAGTLGNGVSSSTPTSTAQEIEYITRDVKQFALSYPSGCAIDASNDLWCWGGNWKGQVGDGTDETRTSPVKPLLQGSSKATMLAGKHYHYCVVDDANKIQCWGFNGGGQLGINSRISSNSPQYVLASSTRIGHLTSPPKSDHLTNVSKIATGEFHSCAIIANSSVRCWGLGANGRIGINSGASRQIADTDMPGINNAAIDIAAGADFTCVLLKDKARVKCWGANGSGQLGNGTRNDSAKPVEVKRL